MLLSAAGTVTEVETTPLLTMEEAIDAVHTAGKAAGIYQPPRGAKKTGARARADVPAKRLGSAAAQGSGAASPERPCGITSRLLNY